MTDKLELDVGICFAFTPPIIIPLTERAKEMLPIGEGDAAMFPEDNPSQVLALFGEDMVVGDISYAPNLIVVMSIKQLH